MIIATILLFFVAGYVSAKVPDCDEHNNNGVFNEFGHLPPKVSDSKLYSRVFRGALTTINTKRFLSGYTFEAEEYKEQPEVGTSSLWYYKIMFKDKESTRIIDYVRVHPSKWQNLEDAILFADETPSDDKKIRIKFLISDCSCVMRTYDLSKNDIVDLAVTSSCDDEQPTTSNPHSTDPPSTETILLRTPTKMTADDVFPHCDPNNNVGVMPEFGPLPPDILDDTLFQPVHTVGQPETLSLTGYLHRYKVQYKEYRTVYWTGTHLYGYLTLYFLDQKTSTSKVLDYLRVNVNKWKNIQQAIVIANHKESDTRTIKIKFSTSTCRCVERTYNLDAADVPADAKTTACNGDPMTTPAHTVAEQDTTLPEVPDINKFNLETVYPGCKVGENVGVLDVFGPLPTDLNDLDLYYKVESTDYANRYSLSEIMDNYEISYSEYREKSGMGKIYSFLTLYYVENGDYKKMDYFRVHPRRWDSFQAAILEVESDEERKLRISYLTADCTCKMRVYDLSQSDIVGKSVTMTCDGLSSIKPSAQTTVVEEQATLKTANKVNYEMWSL